MKSIECLQAAVEYIEDNIYEKVNISEIANQAYMSEHTFTELFASITGFSVAEYMRHRRLTLAVEEILHSNDKIIDIAYRHGYESPESFSRAFKRFHGLSPVQIRKQKGSTNHLGKLQFTQNNVVNPGTEKAYRVLENGPVYYTKEMDLIVTWFRDVLGWVANVDIRDNLGVGMFGCAMPIPEDIVSEQLTSFMGFSLFYGEPSRRVVGFIAVDRVDQLHDYIISNGWTQITDIVEQPWGARECSVTTPDGCVIKFSSYY